MPVAVSGTNSEAYKLRVYLIDSEAMPYTDQQLRDAVDAVFSQFDKDNSNSLDANEVYNLISAALKHMNSNAQVSQEQVQGFVQAVDKSGDGKIQKPELFEIFKKVLQ